MSSRSRPVRLYSIQVLRGLAAVLVVMHHITQHTYNRFPQQWWNRVADNGAFGVDIFFPISGYVMYLTASKAMRGHGKPGNWQDFAWRRFVRVAPLYWFFTAFKLLLLRAVPALVPWFRATLPSVIGAFLFFPMLNPLGQPEPPVGVGWTLTYEMLFYAIVASAIAFGRPLLRWCGAIIGVLAVAGLFIPHPIGLAFLADPIELEFLAGMALCAGFQRGWRPPVSLAAVVLPGSLLFALLAPASPYVLEFQRARALVWGVPGALIVWAAVALEQHFDLSRWRALLLLGDASFSLYLLHTFVVPAIASLSVSRTGRPGGGELLFCAVALACSIALSIVFHLWVELPVTRRILGMRTPWSMHSADAA